MLVVASKVDVCQDESRIEAVRQKAAARHAPFYKLSAVTGEGLEELRFAISAELFKHADATISVGS